MNTALSSILDRNINRFEPVYNKNYLKELFEKLPNLYEYKFVQIINNELFLYSKNNTFSYETRMEAFKKSMLDILGNYKMPDMEFIYFDGDSLNTDDLILVSTSCKKDREQILLPDWSFEFWPETHLFNYERDIHSILLSAKANGIQLDKWMGRKDRIFYRGSFNRSRTDLCNGVNHDLLDVAHVPLFNGGLGNPNFEISENSRGCSRESKATNKFLLQFNGGEDADYSSAFRFSLAACCLTFYLTRNETKEWWQERDIFKDGTHYVLASSPEELTEKAYYYKNNPSEAFEIAHKGYHFFIENLMKRSVTEYYVEALRKYSSLLKYSISAHPLAEKVVSYSCNNC